HPCEKNLPVSFDGTNKILEFKHGLIARDQQRGFESRHENVHSSARTPPEAPDNPIVLPRQARLLEVSAKLRGHALQLLHDIQAKWVELVHPCMDVIHTCRLSPLAVLN